MLDRDEKFDWISDSPEHFLNKKLVFYMANFKSRTYCLL